MAVIAAVLLGPGCADLIPTASRWLEKKHARTFLYNKTLLEGEDRIIQKVGEEAIETIIAAKNKDKKVLINETSDLIYHLFVLLVEKGIPITEIAENLHNRHKK